MRNARPVALARTGAETVGETTVSVPPRGIAVHDADGCPVGLYWPDGIRRCWRHTDADGRALVDDLDRRAARVGVPRIGGQWTNGPGRAWPYGPNVYIDMRPRMLDWAERHGLTLAGRGARCLDWLRFGRCGHGAHRHVGWLDHVTAWKRGDEPAVLLAQPYAPALAEPEAIDDLVELAGDPHLFIDVNPADGWYGHGTRPVAIWWRWEQ